MSDLHAQLRDIIVRNFQTSDLVLHEWYFPSEWEFTIHRKFRIDLAWPKKLIGFEVNGGTWMKGKSGHSSGVGIRNQYEKINHAQSLGWRIFVFDNTMLMDEEYVVSVITVALENLK